VMGKSVSNRSFEEVRLEENKILKLVEVEVIPVQGTESCRASVKTVCIPSAQVTRNGFKNCAIISFQTRSYFAHLVI